MPVVADAPAGRPSTLGVHVRSRFASAFWSGIANALPRAALLATGLYVALRFGPDAFARYSLTIVTITVAGGIVATSITTLGARYVSEQRAAHGGRRGAGFSSLLAFGLALAVVLGALVFALAPVEAALFGGGLALADSLGIAALVVIVLVVHGALNGLAIGSARFALAAAATMVGAAAFAVALVPLAGRLGISGALLAVGVFHLGALVSIAAWAARPALDDLQRTSRIERHAQWKAIAMFLAPVLLFTAMVPVVVWSCNIVLTRGAQPLPAIARFNAAYNWYAVAAFVPNVLAQVEFVHLSQARARGDAAALVHILKMAVLQNILVMLPLAALGAALAGPLMALFHVDDADGRRCLQLMLAAALIASVSNPTGVFFAVVDRIWIATALNLAWAVVALTGAWIWRDSGAVGIALAFVVAYAVHLIAAVVLALRFAGSSARLDAPRGGGA